MDRTLHTDLQYRMQHDRHSIEQKAGANICTELNKQPAQNGACMNVSLQEPLAEKSILEDRQSCIGV